MSQPPLHKLLKTVIVAFSVLLLNACVSTPVIRVNTDKHADFSAYHTYGFVEPLGTDKAGYTTLERLWYRPCLDVNGMISGFTGDGAKRDEDGYFWILGRVDDVLNVAGHRIGTMEIESALVSHPAVAEAAAVGKPHEVKGSVAAAFVILRAGHEASSALIDDLKEHVSKEIGAIARPEDIIFTADLPKTRSGKITRPDSERYTNPSSTCLISGTSWRMAASMPSLSCPRGAMVQINKDSGGLFFNTCG